MIVFGMAPGIAFTACNVVILSGGLTSKDSGSASSILEVTQ